MKGQMKFKKSLLQENYSKGVACTAPTTTLNEFLRQIDRNKSKLKKIESLLTGSFKSIKSGTGFDFNEIREYMPGDDLRHISWNVTAKKGELHTKEYFAEKEVRGYFLVDISNSMFCGSKLECFVNLFSILLSISCNICEKIGGVFFGNEIKYYFETREVNSQANIMFKTLLDFYDRLQEKADSSYGITKLLKIVSFTKQYFSKKGLVFLISDFINLEGYEKAIYELSQKQNIYSFQIYDPVDFNLPKTGYLTLVDPETKERFIVNTDSKKLIKTYNNLMEEKQNKIKSFLQSIGVRHITIEKNDF